MKTNTQQISRHKTEPLVVLEREDWLSSQRFLDELSLALHGLVVEKLRQNSSQVLRVARDNLTRWLSGPSIEGSSNHALLEWLEMLDQSTPEEICDIITQDTDEGQRLRSSSLFAGVLSEAEREDIWRTCVERRPL